LWFGHQPKIRAWRTILVCYIYCRPCFSGAVSLQHNSDAANPERNAWDRDYRQRGRLWGGAKRIIPDLPAGSRVLEIGCGNGKTLAAMLHQPWQTVALDISSRAAEIAMSDSRGFADVLVADACQLPFKDDSFDAVLAFHITGHLLSDGRRLMASESARVLRPGGKLFFRDFGADDMRSGQGREVEPKTYKRGEGILTHYFTEKEAVKLFSMLRPESIRTHAWKMRIRGQDLLRSEIEACLNRD